MFLRTTTQKRSDGSRLTHYQLAESVWDPVKKRSKTKIVYNCGRADDPEAAERLKRLARSILKRFAPEEIVASDPTWTLVDAWPYGDLFVLEALWKRLGVKDAIESRVKPRRYEFSLERALFAMVANRACSPFSKLYCYEQWLREDVRIEGADELELHHLYRAMDFLDEHREDIEEEVFYRVSDLLNLDVDLIFYDTTSLHFEIEQPDDDTADEVGLRKRGYSKNGRGDAPQLVVGLAVTRDGLPVRHWVFPGNTVDVSTVEKVKADLRRWKLGRCVFVGDAGMVSKDNLHKLSLGGGKYIVSMPVHRGGEVAKQVLTRAGRYKTVTDNLQVKEVTVGDGERRRRYVVCRNPLEEARQRQHREGVLAELEAELGSLKAIDGELHSKRVCRLMASRRYSKYLRLNKAGNPVIDRAAIRKIVRTEGKFIIHSNDDSLTAEDLALGYKQLMRVEESWRTLKTGLQMRPVYHWAPHRIRAHIALSVLALLLERAAERACEDTWRNIRDDLKQVKLAQLISKDGEVWQVTAPRADAASRLKSLSIDNLPTVLKLR